MNSQLHTEFFVQTEGHCRLTRVDASALLYLRSDWNYVHLHLDGTEHVVYVSLRGLLAQLRDFPFVQVHKSYAINLEKLEGVAGNRIILCNGTEIPLGRHYRKAFFAGLAQRIIKRK